MQFFMVFVLFSSLCPVLDHGPGSGPGLSSGPGPGPGPSPIRRPKLVPVHGPGPGPIIFLVLALVPVPVMSYFWSRPWSRSRFRSKFLLPSHSDTGSLRAHFFSRFFPDFSEICFKQNFGDIFWGIFMVKFFAIFLRGDFF